MRCARHIDGLTRTCSITKNGRPSGGPAVDQTCDVGVLEPGENLALVPEAAEHFIGVHSAPDDFDRHPLLVLIVVALRQVHRAHAAAPDLGEQPVGTEARAEEGRLVEHRSGFRFDRRLNGGTVVVGAKKGLDFETRGRIARAHPIQKAGTLRRRKLGGFQKQLFNSRPGVVRQDAPSRCSHAARLLRIVRDQSRTSMESFAVMPPKKRISMRRPSGMFFASSVAPRLPP